MVVYRHIEEWEKFMFNENKKGKHIQGEGWNDKNESKKKKKGKVRWESGEGSG